ncbi:hypothetical protein CNEO2_250045 [Clostridium neonatale]|nr:hypothetical protein CNEO2_250045 [Clostridium neonatale]
MNINSIFNIAQFFLKANDDFNHHLTVMIFNKYLLEKFLI